MLPRLAILGLAGAASALANAQCGAVLKNDGEPVGEFKDINGTQIYHSYPPSGSSNTTAILYLTDIFGVPNPQAKLLADSLASAAYPVIMPDLFKGDAVPLDALEGPGLNLTEWLARHPQAEIDGIIEDTIAYIRTTLSIPKIAAVGYCFGGKYVPRHMTASSGGIDIGFIAHPSNLLPAEIEAISGPISIAAGELDASYNATHRDTAEGILMSNNVTFEASLYSGAPHGFGVKVDWAVREQRYAKTAAFEQALRWFGFWA